MKEVGQRLRESGCYLEFQEGNHGEYLGLQGMEDGRPTDLSKIVLVLLGRLGASFEP